MSFNDWLPFVQRGKKGMRVCHVITRLIVGGAQENTLASVLGLSRIPPWKLELISGRTHGAEGSLEPVALAVPGLLRIEPDLVRPIHPYFDLAAYWRLRRHFKSTHPVIVHTHSGKAGIIGRLAARHAGVPVVIHTVHGPSFGPFQGGTANWILKAAERLAGRVTDRFVVVANAMERQYLAAGIGNSVQYVRIFSGFNLDPYLSADRDSALGARLGLNADHFVVGKIARLFELKGHDDLFQVAPALIRRLPNIRFLIVGDGLWRARFEAMAAQQGLRGHFIFTGLVRPDEVPSYVGLMDALVHLSRREGLARALPQAAAAGKPLVAYDCDGASEVCRDGQTGFLVPPGATARLVDSIWRLASDPLLRIQMGESGRSFVRDRFSTEAMVQGLDNLYRECLKDQGRQIA